MENTDIVTLNGDKINIITHEKVNTGPAWKTAPVIFYFNFRVTENLLILILELLKCFKL